MAGRDPHDVDGVADHIAGTALAFGASGHVHYLALLGGKHMLSLLSPQEDFMDPGTAAIIAAIISAVTSIVVALITTCTSRIREWLVQSNHADPQRYAQWKWSFGDFFRIAIGVFSALMGVSWFTLWGYLFFEYGVSTDVLSGTYVIAAILVGGAIWFVVSYFVLFRK